MGFRGLGFGVWGLEGSGFRVWVWGLGFRVLGCRVKFRVKGLGSGVQGLGFRV